MCGNLATPNYVCNVTSDLASNGSCFNVQADNVTIECNGHSITGNNAASTYGVYSGQSNTTVKNCIITGFEDGIQFNGASNGIISSNTINVTNAARYTAIRNTGSSANTIIQNNTLYSISTVNTAAAITVNSGSGVVIDCMGKTITGVSAAGTWGVYSAGTGTTVKNCNVSGFSNGIRYSGSTDGLIQNNTIAETLTGGYAVYITSSAHRNSLNQNTITTTSAHGIVIDGGNNVTVDCMGANIAGNDANPYLGISTINIVNLTVKNCNISKYTRGISLNNVTNSTVDNVTSKVTQTSNGQYGIILQTSNYTTITNSVLSSIGVSTTSMALYVYLSTGVIINNCTATGRSSTYGSLLLQDTTNATVANSTINGYGMTYAVGFIKNVGGTVGTRFINNTILNATTLLYLDSSASNNTFCLNNFSNSGTSPTTYVQDLNGSNYYNCTYNGSNQGNIWANVLNGSISVYGSTASSIPGLYIGTSGAGVPYSNTTASSGGKFSCNFAGCADYAPLTNASTAAALQCGNLSSANTVYNMTANASINGSTCFTVTAANVTLNCAGWSITGNNSTGTNGIYTTQANTTVMNCVISNFQHGVQAVSTDKVTVKDTNITITRNDTYPYANAIYMTTVSNVNVTNCNLSAITGYGMFVYPGTTVSVTNSYMYSTGASYAAIRLANGNNIAIMNNTLIGIVDGMSFTGAPVNVSVANNTIIGGVTSGINLAGSNINIIGNTITATGANSNTLKMSNCNNSIISNNTIGGANNLLYIASISNNNTFCLNNFTATTGLYVNDTNGSNHYNCSTATAQLAPWPYMLPIDINTTVASSLTNFPALVSLNTTNSTYWNATTCANVRFTDSSKNILNYEVESCGNSTVNSTFWVQGNYAGSALTRIYAYLGNTGAASGENKTGTWDSNFVAVYHLGNGTTLNAIDTIYGNNGTITTPTAITGMADGGALFNSTAGDHIYIPNSTNYDSTTSTWSIWVKSSGGSINGTGGASCALFCRAGGASAYNGITIVLSGASPAVQIKNATASIVSWMSGGSVVDGNWHLVTLIAAPNGGMAMLYVDGVKVANASANGAWTFSTNTVRIGYETDTTYWGKYNGSLDEARISNTNRSADWIKAEYAQTASPGAIGTTPNEGNIWANVINGSVQVYGTSNSSIPGLYIGSSGSGYPYGNSTSGGKFSCNFAGCADYAPLTNASAPTILRCGALSSANMAYNMTTNASISGSTCFNVTAANVTLNCAGFSIAGNNSTGTYGVYSNQPNTTVKNCNISNFDVGIYFAGGAKNGTIDNVNASTTKAWSWGHGAGIFITGGGNDSITNSNTIAITGVGIYLGDSNTNSTITNSTGTSGSSRGIYIYNTISIILSNFTGTSNSLIGICIQLSPNTIINNSIARNLVSGTSSYGIVVTAASHNTQIINTTASSNRSSAINIDGGSNVSVDCQGISLMGTNASGTSGVYSNQSNTTVKNCIIKKFPTGIYLNSSANRSTLYNNTIRDDAAPSDSAVYGIYAASPLNNISSNTLLNLTAGSTSTAGGAGYPAYGIYLASASSSILFGNIISNITGAAGGDIGTSFATGGAGGNSIAIYLSSSSSNNITSNAVSGLFAGIGGTGGTWGGGGTGGTASAFYISSSNSNNLSSNNISSLTAGTGGTSGGGGGGGVGGTGGTSAAFYLISSASNLFLSNIISTLSGGSGGGPGAGGNSGAAGFSTAFSIDSNSYSNTFTSTQASGDYYVPASANTMDSQPVLFFYNATSLNISSQTVNITRTRSAPIYLSSISISAGLALTSINKSIITGNSISGIYGSSGAAGSPGGTSAAIYLSSSNSSNLTSNIISNITAGIGGTGGNGGTGGTGGAVSAIYLSSSSFINLTSNSISTLTGGAGGTGGCNLGYGGLGGSVSAIYLISSSSNSLSSNNIAGIRGGTGGAKGSGGTSAGANGSSSGVVLSSTSDSAFSSILVNGSTGYGIYAANSSNRNNFTAISINTSGSGHGIYINGGSNGTFDCQGGALLGANITGTYGVYSTQFNTTVKNCNISNFAFGIYFNTSRNSNIQNSTIHITSSNAALATHSAAILLIGSNYSTLSNNFAYSQYGYGIYLSASHNSQLISSNATSASSHAVCINQSDSASVIGGTLNASMDGVDIASSTGALVANNTVFSGRHGIHLEPASQASVISGNVLSNSTGHSIFLDQSSNNSISFNAITRGSADAGYFGIYLSSSANNSLSGNAITVAAGKAISINSPDYGCNNISNNVATANGNGTGMDITSTGSNIFSNNYATGGGYGIFMGGSANNSFTGDTASTSAGTALFITNSPANRFANITIVAGTGTAMRLQASGGSDGNAIEGMRASGGTGIYLDGVSGTNISGMNVTAASDAVYLAQFTDDTLLQNGLASSGDGNGITVADGAIGTTISNVSASSSSKNGISVEGASSYASIYGAAASSSSTGATGAGIYLATTHAAVSNSSGTNTGGGYGLWVSGGEALTVAGSTFTSAAGGVSAYFEDNSAGNMMYGNTFLSSSYTSDLLRLSHSTRNTFYWNTFGATAGFYAKEEDGQNFYNSTIPGQNEGNSWYNLAIGKEVSICGSNRSAKPGWNTTYYAGSDSLADPSQYPYNAANARGMLYGTVADYAPMTADRCAILPPPAPKNYTIGACELKSCNIDEDCMAGDAPYCEAGCNQVSHTCYPCTSCESAYCLPMGQPCSSSTASSSCGTAACNAGVCTSGGETCPGSPWLSCCPSSTCSGGVCVAKKAAGEACASATECAPQAPYCTGGACSPCLPIGAVTCASNSECCGNSFCNLATGSSDFGACVGCLSEGGRTCTSAADCCSGSNLTCKEGICAANHPPAVPFQVPVLSLSASNGTITCVQNCVATNMPPDPDFDTPVRIEYRWLASNTPITGFWHSSTSFSCELLPEGCTEGMQIKMQVRACDRYGACSAPNESSAFTLPAIGTSCSRAACSPAQKCCSGMACKYSSSTSPAGTCLIASPMLNCSSGADCLSGLCRPSLENSSVKVCVDALSCGQSCNLSSQCPSGCSFCADGACSACIPINSSASCASNSQCCAAQGAASGLCSAGLCKSCVPQNASCALDVECCSGSCQDSLGTNSLVCAPPKPALSPIGAACLSDSECAAGFCDTLNRESIGVSSYGANHTILSDYGQCVDHYAPYAKCSASRPGGCESPYSCALLSGSSDYYCISLNVTGDMQFSGWAKAGGVGFARSAGTYHSGASSASVSGAEGSYAYNSALMGPLAGDAKYVLSFWARVGTTGTPLARYALYDTINNAYLSASGQWLYANATGGADGGIIEPAATDTAWRQVVNVFKTLPNARMQLRFYPISGVPYNIDDVSVTQASDFSMLAWVRADAIQPGGVLFSQMSTVDGKPQGINWAVGTDNTLTMGMYSSSSKGASDGSAASILPAVSLADCDWHQVALSVDRTGNYSVYLDGVLYQQPAGFSLGSLESSGAFYIGSPGASGFAGELGEVRFYKRSLTPADVLGHYNGWFQQQCSMNLAFTYSGAAAQNLTAAYNAGLRIRALLPETMLSMPFDVNVSSDERGMIVDYSRFLGAGTKTGAAWVPDGKVGGAYEFNTGGRTTDKIMLPSALLSGTGDFTLSAWINTTGASANNYIMGNYDSIRNANGTEFFVDHHYLGLLIQGYATSPEGSIQDNEWYHVAATRQGGVARLYINGAQAGSSASLGTPITSLSNFAIGNGPDYISEPFSGRIDEVRVFSRALTDAEILALYDDNALASSQPLPLSQK
ncbi:MAG: DUF2341 domain-containing protein [Candidatus Micrarchaeota archaeon]|nr:DUF2341 domain-containing protein [Candidatus Micrarchaeota archaeon]